MEALRAKLTLAKEQARASNAAALKAVEDLRAEHAAHHQSEETIAEMVVELKNVADRYELLEKENQANYAELKKALDAAKEPRSDLRDAREELRQAGEIAAGNPYLLRMKFLDPKYTPLDRRWSPADAYADLSKSTADATKFFEDQKDDEVEKLFWSQFSAPTCKLPLSEKMAAVAALHRLSGLANAVCTRPSMAEGAEAGQLFWFSATIPWRRLMNQCHEEVGMHRGCTDGSCPC